ncbi:dethiobiotin synthase [Arsenophonus symbiont of Ornithomya chloropus]|uniref:dethiobiotin synthase n=1 Tax=Arsenophonus symbiont of Ornithomya chloropus TaxID=634121 RepID=UPI0032B15B11
MNKYFFLTGTDTDIGKTVVSCALLQAASYRGYKTAGYKPIAAGSKQSVFGLRNLDAELLRKNSTVNLSYNDVNPIVFLDATSPNIAAQRAGGFIDCKIMTTGLQKLKDCANWIIIEGAGGWYTPFSFEKTFADWVIEQQLPVILTVGIKLGCINHAILTAQAIKNSGLFLIGWIANKIILSEKYEADYLLTLQKQLSVPCLGVIPYCPNWESNFIGKFIKFSKILDRVNF